MNEQGTGTIRRTETLIAGFVAAVLSITLVSEARAGTYVAWECGGVNGGPGGTPDVRGPFGSASLTAHNSCSGGGGEYGVVSFDAWNTNGSYLAYEVFAPNGTRFLNGYADVAIANRGNYQGYVSIGNGSGHSNHVATDTWGFWTGAEWVGQSDTNQFTVWLYCPVICGPGEGPGSGHAYAYARNLIFNVQDYSPPGASLSGSLTGGAWRNSGGNLTVHGTDQGSGVHTLETHVNGSRVDNASANCTLTSLFGGTAGDRLTPCPNNTSRSGSYGVGSFQQGANTVTGCVRDFASDGNPNEVCTSTTVRMDTVAPETPSGFTVAGGEAWQPTNDFDVSWSNAAQAHAPIEGAMYRISRNGGGYDSGAQFVSGTNRQSLDNLSVPSPGEYTLRVWTRDAAGNHSEENARTATLRFDPTVPPEAEAEFNGWIRRNDFTYVATWDQVPAGRLGPSGLDGYAVSVTRDPTSDPCMKEGGPSCSAEEINNDGINDTSMPIATAETSEGNWYIHVVPVTGAGVKAGVEHTEMPIDETDPVSRISGADPEWVNHDVIVSVDANDPVSGMAPDPDYPMDPQPQTCVKVGGTDADCEPDDSIRRVISSEGYHQVAYFARDLAGNENNGQPDAQFPSKTNKPANQATVRIDVSGPRLSFSSRTIDDPTLVVVDASDQLSGVADGAIELRPHGSSGDWLELNTTVTPDHLSGRVPDDIDPGRYEFRATATDEAGNSSSTGTRADGTPMVEDLPLKEAVNLTANIRDAPEEPAKGKDKGKCRKAAGRGKCKGKRGKDRKASVRVTVPYGEPIELAGHLRTTSDAPMRGRELEVIERMAEGSAAPERVRAVTTGPDGAYSLSLAAGPSRTVTVRFDGDARYRSTVSDPVDVAVRSKVLAFKAPKKIHEKRILKFRGRVGVDGVDLGSRGKRIELQYEKVNKRGKRTGKWATIDSDEANGPAGAFSIGYPLRSDYGVKTRVRFRALVPPERGWPYGGVATSRVRSTIILP